MPSLTERQSNTAEQMRAYVETAIMVFQEFDLPEDLREIAFSKLLDWAAAKSLVAEPSPLEIAMLRNG